MNLNSAIDRMIADSDVWAEINARPSKLRPFGSALGNQYAGTVERCPIIGPTVRLRSEPPCPACGNTGRYHCDCEVEL